jgi:2-polyprenyl-6-methoxyphenol hydroxylase-like FAD-dependent oxidoreductase
MTETTDVVVVGGGIGGAALAVALANAGLGVTVLEASDEFADRVRGESMQPWGVKEARDLGVEPVLLDAGAHITTVWKQYREGVGFEGDRSGSRSNGRNRSTTSPGSWSTGSTV